MPRNRNRQRAARKAAASAELRIARAEMVLVNERAILAAQRAQTPPVDYGVPVKQGFVCGQCRQKRARFVPLRVLVHVSAEEPETCRACAGA